MFYLGMSGLLKRAAQQFQYFKNEFFASVKGSLPPNVSTQARFVFHQPPFLLSSTASIKKFHSIGSAIAFINPRMHAGHHLAPLWAPLANCAKGEQQSVLQQELTKVCLARGLAPELYCPTVTTGLKQMVTTFNFAGHGSDDLTSGCQPS
jgi:hypothetical protein